MDSFKDITCTDCTSNFDTVANKLSTFIDSAFPANETKHAKLELVQLLGACIKHISASHVPSDQQTRKLHCSVLDIMRLFVHFTVHRPFYSNNNNNYNNNSNPSNYDSTLASSNTNNSSSDINKTNGIIDFDSIAKSAFIAIKSN